MKIRLMGTWEECTAFVQFILKNEEQRGNLEIRNVSDWYANRGASREGRVYVEVE